jgi:hypothetical protein
MGLPVAEGWFLLRRRREFEDQFLFTPEERATGTLWKGGWLWWPNAPAEMRTPIVHPVACHIERFLLLDLMYQ